MPYTWTQIAWKIYGLYELQVYELGNADSEYDGARWYVLVGDCFGKRKVLLDFEVYRDGRRMDYLQLDRFYGTRIARPFIVEGNQ